MKTCTVCASPLQGQQQKYCCNACKQKDHYHRVKEQTNTYHSQTLRALRRKLKLIALKGGGCSKCGYAKNMAALHFHHIDADKKAFKLGARMLSNRSWEAIVEEAEKCILLCANCHSEEHNPELSLSTIHRLLTNESEK